MKNDKSGLLPGLRPITQIMALLLLGALVFCDRFLLDGAMFSSRLWHFCVWGMVVAGGGLGLWARWLQR